MTNITQFSQNGQKSWLQRLNFGKYTRIIALAAVAVLAAGCMGGGLKSEKNIDKMIARFDDRMAEIKGKLNLTSEQMPLWTKFETVTKEQVKGLKSDIMVHYVNMKDHDDDKGNMKGNRPNIIERMNRMDKVMSDNNVRLKAIIAVATPLYNSFSAEQKKLVDEELGEHHGRRHHKFW